MPAVLRAAGLRVEEIAGWETRGHGNFSTPKGVLLHHTAGPAAGTFPSRNTVVNGRPDLAGPLANLGLGRDGTWFIVAAGQAWHAGKGYVPWCGRDNGSAHLIGVEAESTGKGDWTREQLDTYPRGTAALLRHLGLPAERALAHKEWAPRRKPDPHGWPGDMTGFRTTVRSLLEGDDLPSAQEIAEAVWARVLVHPDNAQLAYPAWVWHCLTNTAAWRAANGDWWQGTEPSAIDPEIQVRRVDLLRFADANAHATRGLVAELDTAVDQLARAVADKHQL
ncbi:N-acetylmuramoyl-L-alanine amidase [Allokutzneria sp. A3M-2-11 16]|uniref:peptidoglycan recognition protein family protein n=1 Tax=Allokutzneria sp. A3M-2-11 16 TaxID=2962043 RepID=UPI0020B72DCE|nr:N-acetylmuramoyl-L-alanine amidase [Allokutzneria sp. A3M-2-11 16]MCP3801864.1 N-acetylmuramoyl-L-alanine amidase [Allokutzneria sp. A3M-2-11 16]